MGPVGQCDSSVMTFLGYLTGLLLQMNEAQHDAQWHGHETGNRSDGDGARRAAKRLVVALVTETQGLK